jgi:hypothetical protein
MMFVSCRARPNAAARDSSAGSTAATLPECQANSPVSIRPTVPATTSQ